MSRNDDLTVYAGLVPQTRDYLADEYGMNQMTFDGGKTYMLVASDSDGWCDSCACSDCGGMDGCGCGDVGTVVTIHNLRVTTPADEDGEGEDVSFDYGDRLCESCGEQVYHDTWSEFDEAAREDAAERAWEMAREER